MKYLSSNIESVIHVDIKTQKMLTGPFGNLCKHLTASHKGKIGENPKTRRHACAPGDAVEPCCPTAPWHIGKGCS